MTTPELRVHSDFDHFFENLVNRWIEEKRETNEPFNHTAIVVTAGPFRSDAVSYESKGGIIHLDFYSALRTGFGSLSSTDIDQIKGLL